MTKFIRITVAPLALVALIAACGKSDDVAADSRGRILVLDPAVRSVRIFEPKQKPERE